MRMEPSLRPICVIVVLFCGFFGVCFFLLQFFTLNSDETFILFIYVSDLKAEIPVFIFMPKMPEIYFMPKILAIWFHS